MALERRLVFILVKRSCTIVRNANSHIINDYNSIFVLNANCFEIPVINTFLGFWTLQRCVNCICGLGRFGSLGRKIRFKLSAAQMKQQ